MTALRFAILLCLCFPAPLMGAEIREIPIGMDGAGAILKARVAEDAFTDQGLRQRIVLIGPSSREWQQACAAVCEEWELRPGARGTTAGKISLSAVFVSSALLESPTATFPPTGTFYSDKAQVEAQYLWRWLSQFGPDLVIIVQGGKGEQLLVPDVRLPQFEALRAKSANSPPAASLARALADGQAIETGAIPAVVLETSPEHLSQQVRSVLRAVSTIPSPARSELERRRQRSAVELTEELSQTYGKNLDSVVYIPAVAIMARVRLGAQQGETKTLRDVERIVAPYVEKQKPSLPEKPSSSHLSGHLIFAELAKATNDARYVNKVREAADLGFDGQGRPLEAMPFHTEMSDSVFMGCPILAAAGRLTGERKYYGMMLRHLRFMQKLCLREDGLYRHSPLDEAAWGRGNGFPALGLALCLEYLPAEAAERAEVQRAFQAHMQALIPYQDASGMWHQVVDHPESYREFSCTCMITYAMARGIREGWLDRATYAPVIARSWPAIRQRVGPQGTIVDICTGTGKQRSLQDYFHRTAILGRDDRGGAMAMLVATEMALH